MSAKRFVDRAALSADWVPVDATTHQKRRESPDVGEGIARQIRSLVCRTAEGDQEAFEELLVLGTVLDQATKEAGRAFHARGYSWTYISAITGTTRQSTRERFGLYLGDDDDQE